MVVDTISANALEFARAEVEAKVLSHVIPDATRSSSNVANPTCTWLLLVSHVIIYDLCECLWDDVIDGHKSLKRGYWIGLSCSVSRHNVASANLVYFMLQSDLRRAVCSKFQ